MGYLQEMRRGLSTLASIRPEQSAVPSALSTPLLRNYAQRASADVTGSMNLSNMRLKNAYALSNIGKDIKSARRDSMFALPIEVGNVALSLKMAAEQKEQAKRETEMANRTTAILQAVGEMYEQNPDEVFKILFKGTSVIPEEAGS